MFEKLKDKVELRDIILGGQDGLVNVLGLCLGLFAAHSTTRIIIIAGLVAGVSEAVSMGAVSYTSNQADKMRIKTTSEKKMIFSAFVVCLSAFIGALIPVLPFLLFSSQILNIVLAIILSGITLFCFGAAQAQMVNSSSWKTGIKIVFIGLISAFTGFIIGLLIR